MIKVKVTTTSPSVPYIKMTPGSKGIIGKYHFFIDQEVSDADWWVVVHNLPKEDSTFCPKENTILITQETEVVKKFQPRFTKQFNWVITCQKTLKHHRKIYYHQGHQSYLFMSRRKPGQSLEEYQKTFKSFDELNAITEIPKSKTMTAVVSHKQRSPGAVARYNFIMEVKKHFGSAFDIYSNASGVFGSDTKVTGLKWDAVSPYKYVLSIENSYVPHWWTNHLFDAFIAGAYPIYYGHPSVFEYLPKNSLTLIDINDIPQSIATIEKVIKENYYEKHIKDIWEARKLVLEKYNLFQVIVDNIEKLPSSNKKEIVHLEPEKDRFMVFKNKIVTKTNRIPYIRSVAKFFYRKYRSFRYGQKFDTAIKK